MIADGCFIKRWCQLSNDKRFFPDPFTWNFANNAIVRSTISRVLETTMDFLLKRAPVSLPTVILLKIKGGCQICNDFGSLFAYQAVMNENPTCPKCGLPEVVKNGKAREKQRFKCKKCNFQFTSLEARGCPLEKRARVIELYNHGLSIHAATKLEGVSRTSALNWIKEFAKKYMKNHPQPPPF